MGIEVEPIAIFSFLVFLFGLPLNFLFFFLPFTLWCVFVCVFQSAKLPHDNLLFPIFFLVCHVITTGEAPYGSLCCHHILMLLLQGANFLHDLLFAFFVFLCHAITRSSPSLSSSFTTHNFFLIFFPFSPHYYNNKFI